MRIFMIVGSMMIVGYVQACNVAGIWPKDAQYQKVNERLGCNNGEVDYAMKELKKLQSSDTVHLILAAQEYIKARENCLANMNSSRTSPSRHAEQTECLIQDQKISHDLFAAYVKFASGEPARLANNILAAQYGLEEWFALVKSGNYDITGRATQAWRDRGDYRDSVNYGH